MISWYKGQTVGEFQKSFLIIILNDIWPLIDTLGSTTSFQYKTGKWKPIKRQPKKETLISALVTANLKSLVTQRGANQATSNSISITIYPS